MADKSQRIGFPESPRLASSNTGSYESIRAVAFSGEKEHSSSSTNNEEHFNTTPNIEKDPEGSPHYSTEESSDPLDPNVVDWELEDPKNPKNWPMSRKWMIIFVVSANTLMTALGSTIPVSGVPRLMREFNSNNDLLESFVISVYVLGFAFGPLSKSHLCEPTQTNLWLTEWLARSNCTAVRDIRSTPHLPHLQRELRHLVRGVCTRPKYGFNGHLSLLSR